MGGYDAFEEMLNRAEKMSNRAEDHAISLQKEKELRSFDVAHIRDLDAEIKSLRADFREASKDAGAWMHRALNAELKLAQIRHVLA